MKSAAAQSIAYKLIGYYCLIQAIILFCTISGQIFALISYQERLGLGFPLLSAAWLITVAALVLMGWYLIGKGRLDHTESAELSDLESASTVSPKEIQTIAFSILGAYLFVSAFPEFFRSLLIISGSMMQAPAPYEGVMAERIGSRFSAVWDQVLRNSWPNLAKILVEMFIGAWLFYKGSLLSAYWSRTQTKTTPSE